MNSGGGEIVVHARDGRERDSIGVRGMQTRGPAGRC